MAATEALLSCAQDKHSNEIKHISSVLHGVDLQTNPNLLPVCFLSFFHYAKYAICNMQKYIYPGKGLYINSNIGQQLDLVPYFSLLFLSFASVWLTQHADEFSSLNLIAVV